MGAADAAHFKVTHGDPRERPTLIPVASNVEIANDLESVEGVVGAEILVEEDQLTDDVDQVEQLGENVQRDQVVSCEEN